MFILHVYLAFFSVHPELSRMSPTSFRSTYAKPSIVNQQSLVYQFKCDLCDAGYAVYPRRHLHQRVDEHKNASSSIGKHFRVELYFVPNDPPLMSRNAWVDKNGRFGERAPRLTTLAKLANLAIFRQFCHSTSSVAI